MSDKLSKMIPPTGSGKIDFHEDDLFILGSDALILDHFNKKLLSITPNVFYLLDIKEQAYIFPNRGFEEFLGFEKGIFNPLDKERLKELMHPDDYEKYDWFLDEVINAKAGTFLESQYRLKTKDGTWKWFISKESVFMCDFENKPTHIFGVATDITKLKETERRILNSRAQLNAVINSTTDRIWSIDRDFKLIKFNTPFKRNMNLRFGVEVIRGMSIFYASPQEEIGFWTTHYNKSLKGERMHVQSSYNINGTLVFLETIINPIVERDGTINSITCFSKELPDPGQLNTQV